ncbi:MAG: Serine/threonine-protein kinase PK-1 [Syntrophaceae bacterium PtaB.Bin038]|nr:MAG: Serine/threonine-protein kinase PK-1 [Syntrophaceae bacterium PtaB.Bin038]
MKMLRLFCVLLTALLFVFPSIAAAQHVEAVPDVAGMKATDAQQRLIHQGWKVGMEYRTVTNPKQDGTVLATRPPAGSRVSKQQVLILVAGKLTDQARVPNVTGMPMAEAQKALVANRLNAQVIRENTGDPGKNQIVLKQQIAPGTAVLPGSAVPVIVGVYTAAAQARVPSVTGKPIAEAQKILVANKLNAQVTMQPVAEPQRNGVVIAQKVAVGTPLAPGSPVPLVVGQYTPPAQVKVPSVTGKPIAEAQKILAANKLNTVVTQETVTDPAKKGIVIKQSAAPGTVLSPGSQVPLVVGRYEAPAKVPNVVGMHWMQANSALTKAKLIPNVVLRSTSDPKKNDIVLEQGIRAGSDVSPGTKMDLSVGRYRTTAEIVREIQNRQQSNINNPIPPDGVK